MEVLAVTCIRAGHIKLLQSLTIDNFRDVENYVIIPNNGQITYMLEKQQYTVAEGDILLIPSGQPMTITYGKGNNPVTLKNHYFPSGRKYYETIQKPAFKVHFENFSYVTFEAHVLNTINFFALLGMPALVIKDHEPLGKILKNILLESSTETVGSSRMVKAYTEQLVIEIVRHLITKRLFIEKLGAHLDYFNTPRLISILHYIPRNLHGDLSNRMLATVARVSEDYVGQYFKILTGINPQTYVENQRMERAVKLLRTTPQSIRDIGKEVGFKDTAYFCRRFKMKFGIPAGKMRSQGHSCTVSQTLHVR